MKTKKAKPQTINEYIEGFPKDVQKILRMIRQTIHKTAPEAGEKISYQIPTFTFHGNLVSFAGWKSHIGFYPGSAALQVFGKNVTRYQVAKGTVQFPIEKPLPLGLIRRIVKYRMKENMRREKIRTQRNKR